MYLDALNFTQNFLVSPEAVLCPACYKYDPFQYAYMTENIWFCWLQMEDENNFSIYRGNQLVILVPHMTHPMTFGVMFLYFYGENIPIETGKIFVKF